MFLERLRASGLDECRLPTRLLRSPTPPEADPGVPSFDPAARSAVSIPLALNDQIGTIVNPRGRQALSFR